MLRLQQLDHITLTSSDPKRSIIFYRDVLGLEPVYEWPGEFTVLRSGSIHVAIAWWETGKSERQQPPITVHHFAFRVDAETFNCAKEELASMGFTNVLQAKHVMVKTGTINGNEETDSVTRASTIQWKVGGNVRTKQFVSLQGKHLRKVCPGT